MVTFGLLILFAVFILISALFGLGRGLNKSVIRLMTLLIAVLLTFLCAGPLTNLVAENVKLDGMTLGEMLLDSVGGNEMMTNIFETAPLLEQAILVAPAFVISLVLFPVLFLVLKFITWIVFLFVQKPLRRLIFKDNCVKEEAKQKPAGVRVAKRFGGLGVGIVTGAVIFGMIMTPLFSLFSFLPAKTSMEKALDAMVDQGTLQESDADMILDAYGVTDNGLIRFYELVGIVPAGKAYLNSVSKVEANGQVMYLAKELDSLLNIAQTALEGGLMDALSKPDKQDSLYALLGDKAFMDSMMQSMFQSRLLCSAVPELMATVMETIAGGMNVPADKDAVYDNMMADIATAVQTTQIDYAGIEAYEKAQATPATFSRSAFSRMAAPVNQNDLMTQEEYEAEIQKLVKLTTTISNILNKAISGDTKVFADSVADKIVNDVKTMAAQSGQTTVDSFDAASVQTVLSNVNAADISAGEGDAAKLLDQLTDKEKFQTDVATVETITESIRQSVKSALEDETKASQTATTLANVVSDFAGAIASATDENGEMDATKLDFNKIASAVTELQNSNLKDVGSSVLDIVVSGDLGENAIISDALGAVKDGYEKGENIGGTISTAGSLINMGTSLKDNQENMAESLTDLINNLDEFTISLLPKILSTDTIVSMGIPDEFAQPAFDVVETLLKELMKLKNEKDYTNEVESILSLYELATSGVEDFEEEDIGDLVDYAIKSDAIYNTLVSISHSNPFGIQIPDEDTRKMLVDGIEKYYNQSGKTDRERGIYTAVATLLGLEKEVNLK